MTKFINIFNTMKKYKLLILIILISSCSQISEREMKINKTEEIALKVFNAQLSGDIDTFKSFLSDDVTITLTGQLDISQTYDWDNYMKMAGYFGSLLTGQIGGEFKGIIAGENSAVIFADGKMEGAFGEYNNDYALRYTFNSEGKVSNIKEWLSDILLATQLYGQDIKGEHINKKNRFKKID